LKRDNTELRRQAKKTFTDTSAKILASTSHIVLTILNFSMPKTKNEKPRKRRERTKKIRHEKRLRFALMTSSISWSEILHLWPMAVIGSPGGKWTKCDDYDGREDESRGMDGTGS
jgi:hypothetical protein